MSIIKGMYDHIVLDCYFCGKNRYGDYTFSICKKNYDMLAEKFGKENVPFHTFVHKSKQKYNIKIRGDRANISAAACDRVKCCFEFFDWKYQSKTGISAKLVWCEMIRERTFPMIGLGI